MITKHSADDASAKPLQIGLRLARVVSIGNGTVDVCPIGSSVVLHDIPVTSATTMSVGDVINLQVMDNKRFAFASQNAVSVNESSISNVTIQNGDVIIAGEGGAGAGTITGVIAGNGLTGGGTSGSVSINAVAGDGIVVSADSIAVSSDVVRTSRSIASGNGLTGGGNLGADLTLSVALAATSGLNTTSGLAVGQGNGISVGTSTVAVNQAYGFTWTSAHAFNSGFTAAASTFTGLLTGTSSKFTGSINVGTATGSTDGYIYTSGRIGVGKNAADYPLDVAGDIFSSASVRASTSVITQELTGAGATTSVSLTNGTGFKSSQYASGFAGNGWRIYRQDNTAKSEWEVDNLTVRGTLSVYELLIQQIRATNGSIFVSAAAKIESVTGTGTYTLIVEGGSSDYAPFAVGDILRAQRVSLGTSTLVWQSDLTVTAISVGGNTRAFTATLRPGSTAPAAGMEYVRLGNTTDLNRQGAVYLTADDSGAPFIDIVNDVTSHADWGTAAKVKTRIGRLNGIVGGATANYGIWSGTGTASTNSWVKMAEDGILLNNVPLKMYNGALQTVDFAANGNLKIGTNVANASTTALSWNGTTLTIKGDITVTGGDAATETYADGKASSAQAGAQSYSDTELGKIVTKATGRLAFSFATAPTGTGLYLGSTHLGYYNGGWKTYMNNDGDFFLSGTGTQGLTWDRSSNTLAIDGAITARSGNIAGVLTIGTSGGIYQGTGTFATPTTGLKIWNTSGFGRIGGYETGVLQWYAGTDGKLYAGSGSVVIDDSGITVLSSGTDFLPQNAYRFSSATNQDSHIAVYTDASSYRSLRINNTWTAGKALIDLNVESGFAVNENAKLMLEAASNNSSYYSATRISSRQSQGTGGTGELNIFSPGGTKYSGEMNFTSSGDSGSKVVFSANYDGLDINGDLGSSFSSTWVAPTLTTPWANLAGGYTSFSYKRIGDFVFLRGVITRSASTSLTPFTLPANFRPLARQMFVVTGAPSGQSTDSFYRVDVLTTGEIRFVSIGTTAVYSYLSFGNIVFSVV